MTNCRSCGAPIPERDYPAVWPWDGCACGTREPSAVNRAKRYPERPPLRIVLPPSRYRLLERTALPCPWCGGAHEGYDCPQGPTEKHWRKRRE